jgi:hypothetical protein
VCGIDCLCAAEPQCASVESSLVDAGAAAFARAFKKNTTLQGFTCQLCSCCVVFIEGERLVVCFVFWAAGGVCLGWRRACVTRGIDFWCATELCVHQGNTVFGAFKINLNLAYLRPFKKPLNLSSSAINRWFPFPPRALQFLSHNLSLLFAHEVCADFI